MDGNFGLARVNKNVVEKAAKAAHTQAVLMREELKEKRIRELMAPARFFNRKGRTREQAMELLKEEEKDDSLGCDWLHKAGRNLDYAKKLMAACRLASGNHIYVEVEDCRWIEFYSASKFDFQKEGE